MYTCRGNRCKYNLCEFIWKRKRCYVNYKRIIFNPSNADLFPLTHSFHFNLLEVCHSISFSIRYICAYLYIHLAYIHLSEGFLLDEIFYNFFSFPFQHNTTLYNQITTTNIFIKPYADKKRVCREKKFSCVTIWKNKYTHFFVYTTLFYNIIWL